MGAIDKAKRAAVLSGVLALVAASGCRKKDTTSTPGDPAADDPLAMAEDATDANNSETNGQLVTSTLVATSTSGSLSIASAEDLQAGDLGTLDVGDATKALYFPRGCLTVTHDVATRTVTYVFAGCIGPSGLAKLRGEVKTTYATVANTLVLDLVATELQVNGATLDWSAHAEITADGVARTMKWKAQLSGKTARGRELARTTDKTLSWVVGERCLAVSGSSEGKVRSRNLRTEVVDYKRCARGCPEAGGRITTTNVDNGKTVEIRFDGSDQATYVDAKGTASTVPLLCSG